MDSTQDKHTQQLAEPYLYPNVIASKHFPNVSFSRPSILFALAATERTCGFQDKSDDIMTPRCLCVLTCSSGIELMLYELGVTDLDLVILIHLHLKSRKTTSDVLFLSKADAQE